VRRRTSALQLRTDSEMNAIPPSRYNLDWNRRP
jgi:hypothetical protein